MRLEQVATLRPSMGPCQIDRTGQLVRFSMNANVTGRPLGAVSSEIHAQIDKL